jgi:membrane glycosyltransferase
MAEQLPPPTTEASPSPSAAQERKRRLLFLGGGIAIIVVALAILVGGTMLAIQFPDGARSIRDVAIILLAGLSCLISMAMLALLYQTTMLTLMMRDEIKPLLESINETMNTVRGTAVFMSDNIVQPTITVASAFAGVKRVFDSLAGIRSSVKPKQKKE